MLAFKNFRILISVGILGSFAGCTSIENKVESKSEVQIIRVAADPKKGFNFPFFLAIPQDLPKLKPRLVVMPNNSARIADDLVSEELAKKEVLAWKRELAERISSVLMVPAFPRTKSLYSHALVRDTFPAEGSLKRIDLQLIKMMEEARAVIKAMTMRTLEVRVFLFGFSASAMFVNRFSFIHPEYVSAVAFGAPGGWPIVPVSRFKGFRLKYPIGVADLKSLTGKKFNLGALQKVRIFAFLGAEDTNDSVIYRDGYSTSEERLVFKLFGNRPVARWPTAKELYESAGLNAKFHLYNGVGHDTTLEIENDLVDFFNRARKEP